MEKKEEIVNILIPHEKQDFCAAAMLCFQATSF
jgi:hypothetical protein